MNKKEARKVALKWAAALLTSHDLESQVDSMQEDDGRRFRAAVEHIADHLKWEANGRPERT